MVKKFLVLPLPISPTPKRSVWEIIESSACSAQANMERDRELLRTLATKKQPILHFYEWERESATYGHFISPEKLLNLQEIKKRGVDLARRPTGGGIVFHIWDLAFSVLVPATSSSFSRNTLENYAFVNRAVLNAVEELMSEQRKLELIPADAQALDVSCNHFCMAKPTKYDVVLEGKKIAGAAQRMTREGFLHQGTISLMLPPKEELESLLLPETRVAEAMSMHTFPVLGPNASREEFQKTKRQLCLLLKKQLTEKHEV